MARPKKHIDKKQFESLCYIQCTRDEIANILNCDHKTLNRWCIDIYGEGFSPVYKSKSDGGRMSLRRYQLNLAQKNAAMAIWLGKQYLGQTDKIETYNENKDKLNVNVMFEKNTNEDKS